MIGKFHDLEFRVDEQGLANPSEIFYSMAKDYANKGDFSKASSLLNAYLVINPDDTEVQETRKDWTKTKFNDINITSEVSHAVAKSLVEFQSYPIETRTTPIDPEYYIAIHPFDGLKKYGLSNQEKVKGKSKGFLKQEEHFEIVTIKQKDQDLFQKCERLVYDVFIDCNYIDPNPDKRINDFDKYPHQEFLAAFKGPKNTPLKERKLIGALQAIYAPHKDKMDLGLFPTLDSGKELKIFPEKMDYMMSLDPKTIVDMAIMAILPEERDSKASKMLCTRVTTRAWEKKDVRYGLACIDTPFYKKLKDRNYPYIDLGPSVMYWGSPTTATIVDSMAVPKGIQNLAIPYFVMKGALKRAIFREE